MSKESLIVTHARNLDIISDTGLSAYIHEHASEILEYKHDIVLEFVRSLYKEWWVDPVRMNIIWTSVVRVEFWFPQYDVMNIWLSGNHISAVQISSAIIKWAYILGWHIMLEWWFNINGNEIWIDNFMDFASRALYTKDDRDFLIMWVCENYYIFDFYLKKVSLSDSGIEILVWYTGMVKGETTIFIPVRNIDSILQRKADKFLRDQQSKEMTWKRKKEYRDTTS